MIDKWIVDIDNEYWRVERRTVFPFNFTISRSRRGQNHVIKAELISHNIGYNDQNRFENVKKYFDEQIDKMEMQEKRIQELEEKLKKLEASL